MKKLFNLSMLAIAAMAAFSCTLEPVNDQELQEPQKVFEPKVITAYTDADVNADTKTSLSGVSILWATTDNIKGWDGATVHTSTTTAVSDGDKKADFTFDTVSVEDDLLYLAYPAENVSDIDDDYVYATIPTTQTATAGSFADKANVAVAEGLTDNPVFKNVGGLLSFTFNNDNITSVTLFADEDLTGSSIISLGGGDFAEAAIDEGKNYVTVSGTIANGSTYYAVVYPGTYNNLKIEVRNTAGQVATYTNPNTLEVGRNANLHIATLTIPDGKWVTPTKGSEYVWNAKLSDFGEAGAPLSSISAGTPSITWSADYTWGDAGATKHLGTDGTGRGVQIGSGSDTNKCSELVLTTSGYTGYVKYVLINFSHASSGGASVSVKVGETSLKYGVNTSANATTTAGDYLFEADALVKGDITITFANSASKAFYIKSIGINLVPGITVTTSAAADVTSATGTTATLNGSLTLVNGAVNASVTEAGFYYKLTSAGAYTKVTCASAPTSTTTFSYDLTGLTKDSEYTYYAYAIYDGGSEVTGIETEKSFIPVQTGGGGSTPQVVYLETFGSTSSNTAFGSYSGYSATTSMFSVSGAVNSHYSGSGSVGKNNLSAANLSSGYTGASGLSGCYNTGKESTTSTIVQISDIKISGYSNLSVSFGALGGSSSHKVNVSYIIDGGSEQSLISNGSITNAGWTLLSEEIAETGTSLTLIFKHTPSKSWTIRLDDIKVTGTN